TGLLQRNRERHNRKHERGNLACNRERGCRRAALVRQAENDQRRDQRNRRNAPKVIGNPVSHALTKWRGASSTSSGVLVASAAGRCPIGEPPMPRFRRGHWTFGAGRWALGVASEARLSSSSL